MKLDTRQTNEDMEDILSLSTNSEEVYFIVSMDICHITICMSKLGNPLLEENASHW